MLFDVWLLGAQDGAHPMPQMAAAFGIPESRVQELFANLPCIVKKDASRDVAERVHRTLIQIGCRSEVHQSGKQPVTSERPPKIDPLSRMASRPIEEVERLAAQRLSIPESAVMGHRPTEPDPPRHQEKMQAPMFAQAPAQGTDDTSNDPLAASLEMGISGGLTGLDAPLSLPPTEAQSQKAPRAPISNSPQASSMRPRPQDGMSAARPRPPESPGFDPSMLELEYDPQEEARKKARAAKRASAQLAQEQRSRSSRRPGKKKAKGKKAQHSSRSLRPTRKSSGPPIWPALIPVGFGLALLLTGLILGASSLVGKADVVGVIRDAVGFSLIFVGLVGIIDIRRGLGFNPFNPNWIAIVVGVVIAVGSNYSLYYLNYQEDPEKVEAERVRLLFEEMRVVDADVFIAQDGASLLGVSADEAPILIKRFYVAGAQHVYVEDPETVGEKTYAAKLMIKLPDEIERRVEIENVYRKQMGEHFEKLSESEKNVPPSRPFWSIVIDPAKL